MVKRYVRPEPMTLAIGDGANDISMIQVIRSHSALCYLPERQRMQLVNAHTQAACLCALYRITCGNR